MTRERLIDILENTPADPDPYNAVIDVMVKAVNEALDEAADNAEPEYFGDMMTGDVDKQSILKLKIQ